MSWLNHRMEESKVHQKKGHSQDKTVNCKTKLSLGVTVKELTFQVNH